MTISPPNRTPSTRPRPRRARLLAACAMWVVLSGTAASAFGFGLPLQPLNVVLEDRGQLSLAQRGGDGSEPALPLSWLLSQWYRAPDLDVITWTAPYDSSLDRLAGRWGMRREELTELNPEMALTKDTPILAGQRFVVYRRDPEQPARAVGRPHSGRLQNGVPFPEGPFWQLRELRHRHWGTRVTVRSMVRALMTYGIRFPFGPKVRVGELSKPHGGYLKPHRSHRTGRDIDFGYIGRDDDASGNWVHVDAQTIDAEKSWFVIKSLIATGNVQSMYIDKTLQVVLAAEAAKELSAEELAAVFEYPRRANSHRAIVQHWPGHRDHVHVRFQCASWNALCKPW